MKSNLILLSIYNFNILIIQMMITRLIKHSSATFVTLARRRTYYEILGVENDATLQQIKEAYQNLSQLYHPALSKNEDHQKLFQEISQAYVILSRDSSRIAYDTLEKESVSTFLEKQQKAEERKSEYHLSRQAKNEAIKKSLNIDSFGRFRGGLPVKKNGLIRGTSISEPGKFYYQFGQTDTPDYQHVSAQAAEGFKNFHQDQRTFRTHKWTWWKAQVDYDYFSFRRYQKTVRYIRNAIFWLYIVPSLLSIPGRYNAIQQQNKTRKEFGLDLI